MALDIHQMNIRSWETFFLSILKAGLLRTLAMSLQLRKKIPDSKRVYDIILQENNKLCAESETHKNIEFDLD